MRVWMLEHLEDDLTLDALAHRARTSRRSFTRQFRAETGTSPHDWLLVQRIIRARLLLETTEESIPAIALRAGLGTDAALRHHFRRVLGVTPTAYRRTFTGL
ncbi:helix-turn-helix domain-containing protein [Actinomycetospora sp. CA-084318]|uniref:helix-turn-helix domain-containing protein n=1 Tax=Actinomycetospora sp. CA-084318 TaxID=3239892 RepID=UPI003D981212